MIDLATTYTAPGFCHGCGKPYPWTAEKLAAAKELALELENLTVEEQRTVAEALDDVVKDTAKTEVASFNIKRLLTKAGQEGASAMKQILIQIGTAYAKQQMGL